MDKKLKPCPFCGGGANVQNTFYEGYDSELHEYVENIGFAVGCPKCNIGTQFYNNYENAIEAWNRRVNNG